MNDLDQNYNLSSTISEKLKSIYLRVYKNPHGQTDPQKINKTSKSHKRKWRQWPKKSDKVQKIISKIWTFHTNRLSHFREIACIKLVRKKKKKMKKKKKLKNHKKVFRWKRNILKMIFGWYNKYYKTRYRICHIEYD